MTGRLNGPALRIVGVSTAMTALAIILVGLSGVRINTTNSLPKGLYVTTRNRDAPLVEFCPPGIFSTLSVMRGYRPPGVCADGAAPLLKPVIAKSGDTVILAAEGIQVNGRLVPNTVPQHVDSLGRTLTAWPFGTYAVAPQSIWVASRHPDSFDSRYFGPISVGLIRHRVRALWLLGSTPTGK